MEDHERMYTGRPSQGQVTDEWINKTDAFLERAFGEGAKGASKSNTHPAFPIPHFLIFFSHTAYSYR